MHRVAILALPNFVPFDLGIPCSAFKYVYLNDGTPAYEVMICGEDREVETEAFTLKTKGTLGMLARADTVIIPGIEDVGMAVSPRVITAIRRAWASGARIATICSGTFVLAATGLLSGKRATTHWLAAEALAQRYPTIEVDADVLYVDEGRIITSAGASAGLDMCLHLIRRDQGPSVAAEAARRAVMTLERDGGQKQFIRYEPPQRNCALAPLLDWLLENLDKPIDVAAMAARMNLTERTFARRFREQIGTTPLQFLLRAKVQRAQALLESSSMSIDGVAIAVGFSDAVTFRARFKQRVGVNPSVYRRRFQKAHMHK